MATKRQGIERARRDGQVTLSDEDRAAIDAQLRAIDAIPERLAPWGKVKARLGLTARRGEPHRTPAPPPRSRQTIDHEAGHFVAAFVLGMHESTSEITIVPGGMPPGKPETDCLRQEA